MFLPSWLHFGSQAGAMLAPLSAKMVRRYRTPSCFLKRWLFSDVFAVLTPSWRHFGSIWAPLRPSWAPFGKLLVPFWCQVDAILRHLVARSAPLAGLVGFREAQTVCVVKTRLGDQLRKGLLRNRCSRTCRMQTMAFDAIQLSRRYRL